MSISQLLLNSRPSCTKLKDRTIFRQQQWHKSSGHPGLFHFAETPASKWVRLINLLAADNYSTSRRLWRVGKKSSIRIQRRNFSTVDELSQRICDELYYDVLVVLSNFQYKSCTYRGGARSDQTLLDSKKTSEKTISFAGRRCL